MVIEHFQYLGLMIHKDEKIEKDVTQEIRVG